MEAMAVTFGTVVVVGLGMALVRFVPISWHIKPDPAPQTRSQATCPPSIGARLLDRSVYREADNGEGVLVCFYELPPVK